MRTLATRSVLGAAVVLLGLSACVAAGGATTSTTVGSTVPGTTSTVPEADSAVGTWSLESMTVDGQPFVLSPELSRFEDHPGVAAWITFRENGLADGHLACNGFKGEYEQRGSVIDWEVVMEAAYCVEPLGAMDAEAPMSDLIFTKEVAVQIEEDAGMLQLAASTSNRTDCSPPNALANPCRSTPTEVVMTFTRIDG